MLQPDRKVLFSRSILLNTGKKVPVLCNVTNLWMHRIVPSDSLALTSRVNGITPIEHCDRKCTGLVTV